MMRKLLLLATLLISAASFANAAIGLDAVSTFEVTASTTTATWSHTVAGSNRFLWISIQYRGGGGTNPATGVTYNGVALTFIRADSGTGTNTGGIYRNELWYLIAPATGAHNVIVTFTGDTSSTNGRVALAAVSLTEVDQSNPINIHGGRTGIGTDASVTLITNVPNCWILSSLSEDQSSQLPSDPVGTPANNDWNLQPSFFFEAVGDHKATTTAGSNTIGWFTASSFDFFASAVAIAPAVAGSGSLLSLSPTAIAVSTTGNTITLTGSGTAWTPGTPGSPTFTISGGCTITAQSVASITSATITVNSGGSATTCTVTDPSNSTTLSLPVIASTGGGGARAFISFQ